MGGALRGDSGIQKRRGLERFRGVASPIFRHTAIRSETAHPFGFDRPAALDTATRRFPASWVSGHTLTNRRGARPSHLGSHPPLAQAPEAPNELTAKPRDHALERTGQHGQPAAKQHEPPWPRLAAKGVGVLGRHPSPPRTTPAGAPRPQTTPRCDSFRTAQRSALPRSALGPPLLRGAVRREALPSSRSDDSHGSVHAEPDARRVRRTQATKRHSPPPQRTHVTKEPSSHPHRAPRTQATKEHSSAPRTQATKECSSHPQRAPRTSATKKRPSPIAHLVSPQLPRSVSSRRRSVSSQRRIRPRHDTAFDLVATTKTTTLVRACSR